MAKDFAERSGGALRIRSEPGRGTTISIWLPRAAAPAVKRTRSHSALPAAWECRVLLVDDDALALETQREVLEAARFSVVTAEGAAEALARLRTSETIDVIVTDMSMPDMDGMTLILRARTLRSELPAILLTGHEIDPSSLPISRDGGFKVLTKPLSGVRLADEIVTLLMAGVAA
jgi:CheY-like chemotaxis protein